MTKHSLELTEPTLIRCLTTFSMSLLVAMPFALASAMKVLFSRCRLSNRLPDVSSMRCFTTFLFEAIRPKTFFCIDRLSSVALKDSDVEVAMLGRLDIFFCNQLEQNEGSGMSWTSFWSS